MSVQPQCCRAQRPALALSARPQILSTRSNTQEAAPAPCLQRRSGRRQRASGAGSAASGSRLLAAAAAGGEAGQQGAPLDVEPVSTFC